ncbi:MAG: serine hydrolase domain-containing protein [Gemmatimonadaceae bacterium]
MRSSLLLLSLAASLPLSMQAQLPPAKTAPPVGTPAIAPAPTRGPRDKVEVEAFMDGLMTAYMRDKHIAGITVSVVRDGALLFAKGYGYADVAKRKPVDADKTLFRIGSISKLFTWTAVMQLHEQGKLDLNKDINEYLDFKIPATYPQPITLTDVMTHTPGFEEDGRDLFTDDPAHITPMSKWLPAHMPTRVRPPGTFASYSNWATATAGYIVERVGGEKTWDDYIEKHVINPLGMTHTTTRQPLPAQFNDDMSVGYQWKDGEFVPQKFEIITGGFPAGSIGASATDMAKFMIAHLNNGILGDTRILGEKEAELMHSRLRGHDPRIPGFAYGFYEQSSHGLRLIGHGGDTQYMHSDLALIPSEKVGVFVSTNTDQGAAISFTAVLTAFLDHYYPENVAVITPTEGAKQGSKRYEGEYVFNRMSFDTYQKVVALAGSLPVKAMPDGSILVGTPFGSMRMVSVDTLLFRDVNSGSLIAFREDEHHNITHGFIDAGPMMVMDKMSTLQSPWLHKILLGGGLLLFLILLITAIIRFFIRNTPGRPKIPAHVASGRRAITWAGVLVLVFVGWVASMLSKPDAIFSDNPTALKLALALPVIALILVLWAAWEAIAQWRSGDGTFWMRLRHSGAVVLALIFFWSLNTWNLLGWRM